MARFSLRTDRYCSRPVPIEIKDISKYDEQWGNPYEMLKVLIGHLKGDRVTTVNGDDIYYHRINNASIQFTVMGDNGVWAGTQTSLMRFAFVHLDVHDCLSLPNIDTAN